MQQQMQQRVMTERQDRDRDRERAKLGGAGSGGGGGGGGGPSQGRLAPIPSHGLLERIPEGVSGSGEGVSSSPPSREREKERDARDPRGGARALHQSPSQLPPIKEVPQAWGVVRDPPGMGAPGGPGGRQRRVEKPTSGKGAYQYQHPNPYHNQQSHHNQHHSHHRLW